MRRSPAPRPSPELAGAEGRQQRPTQHLDLDAGTVHISAGEVKNAAAKIFPFVMHPRLGNIIVGQIEGVMALQRRLGRVVVWLFPKPDGSQLRAFHKEWAVATRKAGLPGKLIHDFRRTAVRNMVRSGVQELVAMRLTGFKTRNIFDRYNIVSEADLSAAVERLGKSESGS